MGLDGLMGRPVVVCVSRLMPRKGQDTLIRALPMIQREVPDVALLLVDPAGQRDKKEPKGMPERNHGRKVSEPRPARLT